MKSPRDITRNTLAQIAGRVIMIPLRLTINATLARHLHREGYGEYSLIVVLLLFLNLLVDLGINDIAVREVSRRWKRFQELLPNLFLLKALLTLLAFGAGALSVHLLGYSAEVRSAARLASWVLFFNAMGSIGVIAYRARLDMKFAVFCDLLAESVYLCLILLCIHEGAAVGTVIRLMVLSRMIHAVFMLGILAWKYRPRPGRLAPRIILALLRQSFLLWLSQLMAVTYSYIDVIMLSKLSGEEAVGLYNASYSLIMYAVFFPVALMNSVFPVMCKTYGEDPTAFRQTLQSAMNVLWAAAVPMAVFGSLFAETIVVFLYGQEFAASARALRILIWASAFMFLSVIMPFTFIASHQQNKIIYFGVTGVCLNVGMNLLLIPRYGFVGASLATAATEVIVLSITLFVIFRFLRFVPSPAVFLKCLLAGAAGAAAIHLTRAWGVPASAGAGAVVLLAGYVLLRVFSRRELLKALGRAPASPLGA